MKKPCTRPGTGLSSWACYHYAAALCGSCFPARPGAASAVWPSHISERQRRMAGKQDPPFGFRRSRRHSSLLVAHLEPPNFTPRALIDAVPDGTEHRCIVVTGPYQCRDIVCTMSLQHPRKYDALSKGFEIMFGRTLVAAEPGIFKRFLGGRDIPGVHERFTSREVNFCCVRSDCRGEG